MCFTGKLDSTVPTFFTTHSYLLTNNWLMPLFFRKFGCVCNVLNEVESMALGIGFLVSGHRWSLRKDFPAKILVFVQDLLIRWMRHTRYLVHALYSSGTTYELTRTSVQQQIGHTQRLNKPYSCVLTTHRTVLPSDEFYSIDILLPWVFPGQ